MATVLCLGACRREASNRFVGAWEHDGEVITIGARGFGTWRRKANAPERVCTWRLADAETIVLEFGESTATRTWIRARISPEDTLSFVDQTRSVALQRVVEKK